MDQMTLKDYQQLFSQAATQGEQSEGVPRLLQTLTPGGTLTGSAAIDVYGKGVTIRLTEALGETFEAVWWVCGDEDFFALAKRFIHARPSTTYNLSQYGKEFPEFLDKVFPFPDLPFLGDLARYEWTFKELFHTRQHESVAPEHIQSLAEDPAIQFQFGQAVRLFTSRYAIYDLWKLRGTEHEGKPPVEWDRPQRLVLYKRTQQIFVHELDEQEFQILHSLHAGQMLEAALALISEQEVPIQQDQISLLFQFVFNSGIIEHIGKEPMPCSD